jgi:hypothetical protein
MTRSFQGRQRSGHNPPERQAFSSLTRSGRSTLARCASFYAHEQAEGDGRLAQLLEVGVEGRLSDRPGSDTCDREQVP